jgi:hypothetical protein
VGEPALTCILVLRATPYHEINKPFPRYGHLSIIVHVGGSHITPRGDGCLGVEACGEVDVTTGTCSAGSWMR